MLSITKILFIWLSVLASSAMARNGCRRCYGKLTLGFRNAVSKSVASDVAANALDGCATGKQYALTAFTGAAGTCVLGECLKWVIDVTAYRYCGNGSKVIFEKAFSCSGAICATYTGLNMQCNKSVDCADKCDPPFC